MRLVACTLLFLLGTAAPTRAAVTPARANAVQEKRLERGLRALEKLRAAPAKKHAMRDGWESIIRELDAAVRAAPEGPRAADAALLAAKVRVSLFEASRSPADAKAALAALRAVDDDHPGPLGREALVAAVKMAFHTRQSGDRLATARRLVERYPESPEGKLWAVRLGKSVQKPVLVVTTPSKNAPVEVVSGGEEEEADDADEETPAAPVAAQAEPASDEADPPEPEDVEAPAPKSPPIVRAVKDAVAALTEPEDAAARAAKAKELRAGALQSGSIAAQLGLKVRRIVIDAGHGGKDAGAIGPHGLREKDAALAIARRVATRLKPLGFEVVLTRKKDVFVSLEERTRIANEARADLFVSIHCNAARSRKLSGVETWTLNVASNRYAARLAAFENAEAERTVSDLRMILADLATKANATDARELAQSVQSSLVRTLKSRVGKVADHGTKQALFYVLLGTHMPSILIETGFISNPAEEKRLRSTEFQDGTADAIARGVKDYVDARRRLARAP